MRIKLLISFVTLLTIYQPSFSRVGSAPARQESRFTRLRLPLGVSVEVPKNWRLLDGDINATIETASEAAMNLSGVDLGNGTKTNLFRANSMPSSTYAGIAINATDSEIDPDELKAATEQEIRELSTEIHETMREALSSQNMSILEFHGVRREYVSGHPALVIEYKRTGQQGAVIVQMTRLFLGEKEISLNLSYRESEGFLWKPIVQYIRSSFTVGALLRSRLAGARPLEDNDFLVYQDSTYLFSAWYPKTWTHVPITHPQTRFKVRSENGFDDYSIVVVGSEIFKNMTPKEFVEIMMNQTDPLELLRPYLPDAVLLKKGKSYLSNQEAFFFTYKSVFKTAGVEIPVTVMQWATIKYGNVYTLTFRAKPERFEIMLPVFQRILFGFGFQIKVSSKEPPKEIRPPSAAPFVTTGPGDMPESRRADYADPPPPPPPLPDEAPMRRVIRKSDGALQGAATERVQPNYPPLAKAARVSGAVLVEVLVDEDGNVISAQALSGHPLLKDEAVSAALEWKFRPTQLGGVPVKVIGTITFNFNL